MAIDAREDQQQQTSHGGLAVLHVQAVLRDRLSRRLLVEQADVVGARGQIGGRQAGSQGAAGIPLQIVDGFGEAAVRLSASTDRRYGESKPRPRRRGRNIDPQQGAAGFRTELHSV